MNLKQDFCVDDLHVTHSKIENKMLQNIVKLSLRPKEAHRRLLENGNISNSMQLLFFLNRRWFNQRQVRKPKPNESFDHI